MFNCQMPKTHHVGVSAILHLPSNPLKVALHTDAPPPLASLGVNSFGCLALEGLWRLRLALGQGLTMRFRPSVDQTGLGLGADRHGTRGTVSAKGGKDRIPLLNPFTLGWAGVQT